MKLLFFMRSASAYFRFFEPVLRALAVRGHHVHLIVEQDDDPEGHRWLADLAAEQPLFTWEATRRLRKDRWYLLARHLRLMLDYSQYLGAGSPDAPKLAERAERRVPLGLRQLLHNRIVRTRPVLASLTAAAKLAERAIPAPAPMRRYLRKHRPDAVLVAPHLMPGSLHLYFVKAARALGIRTAICVASWDNLSSKQLLYVLPDVVIVWNETQKREAVELHGVPPERIMLTGAQCYDQWFEWEARPRPAFCSRVGLDPHRPYLLYVCGALFPASLTEAQWVLAWIDRVRSSGDPLLREAGILIRPHPKRLGDWEGVDLPADPNVVVWPRGDARMPVDRDAKADYFDSIFHSAAVVGVNTSAMIEAALVGRRVHTVLVPEFRDTQAGLIHFRYLMEVGGGVLRTAESLAEHLAQLSESLRDGGGSREENRRFLEQFVRPRGLEVPATPAFVDVVEQLGAMGPPRSAPIPLWLRPLQLGLMPVAWMLTRRARRKSQRKAQRLLEAQRAVTDDVRKAA